MDTHLEDGYDDDEQPAGRTGASKAHTPPDYHFIEGEHVRFALDPKSHGTLMPGEHVSRDDEFVVTRVQYDPRSSESGEQVTAARLSDGWKAYGYDSFYFVPYDSEERTEWDGPAEEEVIPSYDEPTNEYD